MTMIVSTHHFMKYQLYLLILLPAFFHNQIYFPYTVLIRYMLARTRLLVGLILGVLILSVSLPVGLSIWLAHQQVETSFIERAGYLSLRRRYSGQ